METDKLIFALQETISHLRTSQSLNGSDLSVEEIIRRLETEINKARNAKPIDVNLLDRLFAPTGVLQEISIGNSWGTTFLRISEVVDEFTR